MKNNWKTYYNKAKNNSEAIMTVLEEGFADAEYQAEKQIVQAAVGLALIDTVLKKCNVSKEKPDTVEATKKMKDDVKLIKKQLDMLEKNEHLNKFEYSCKLCYSVTQLLISAWHSAVILGGEKAVTNLSGIIADYLHKGTDVYTIAKHLKEINEQKRAWGGQ